MALSSLIMNTMCLRKAAIKMPKCSLTFGNLYYFCIVSVMRIFLICLNLSKGTAPLGTSTKRRIETEVGVWGWVGLGEIRLGGLPLKEGFELSC